MSLMSRIKAWISRGQTHFISIFPVWLRVARNSCYRSAREFVYLIAFSFMPVWLGAIFHFLSGESVLNYLNGYLFNGEALLLSATTVGPLMFTLVNSEGGAVNRVKGFPLKWLYYLLVVGVCVVAAAMIGFKSAPNVKIVTSPTAMWSLSLVVSLCSVAVWFAIVTTNSVRESGAANVMRQDEQDFLYDYGVR